MPGSRSLAVVALLFAACSTAENGADAPRRVEFGEVLISESVHRTLELRHAGPGTLQVKAIEADGTLDHGFSWDFVPFALEPNQSRTIGFTFKPTHPGEARSRIRLVLEGSFEDPRTYELVGTGLDPKCVIDPPLFGAIEVGRSATRDAIIRNESEHAWSLELSALEPAPGPFSADYQPGRTPIAPGGNLLLPVTFSSTVEGDFEARLPFLSGPCGTGIRLQASAARELVELPPAVDFGYTAPGRTRRRSITIRNPHPRELALTAAIPSKAVFAVVSQVPEFIAARGELTLEIEFRPQSPQGYSGALLLDFDDRGSEWVQTVGLTGSGAGPRFEIEETLDFQAVLAGTRAVRTLEFRNTGSAPLKFEIVDESGNGTPAAPRIEGDSAFTIDEVRGMATGELAPDGVGQLRIGFEPTDGLHQATLVLFSNDPTSPETRVRLAGGAITPGTGLCKYELDSTTLDFGEVVQKLTAMRKVVVRNVGESSDGPCRIQQASLALGSEPSFSVSGTANLYAPFLPGESRAIDLRFRAASVGNHSGRLELLIGHSTSSMATVDLAGSGVAGSEPAGGAVLIAPSDIDFGTLAVGCESRERVHTIYNVGTVSSVVLERIQVEPGMPAFKVTGAPELPKTLAPGASTEVKLQYKPVVAGQEQAAIEFYFSGFSTPYIVQASGRGAARQTQRDIYVQGYTPKMDVLVVLDDGWTMESKRDLVRTNLTRLVQSLNYIDADWQLALTTTSVCPNGCPNGRFLPLNGAASAKILSSNTPNPEQALSALIDEAGSGGQALSQPLEAAYLATSSANLGGHNYGFLRPAAFAAIFFITDSADASPQPVGFYKSHFQSLPTSQGIGGVDLAAVHPLGTPEVAGCSYRTATVDHSRLSQVAYGAELCRADWGWAYGTNGSHAKLTRFFLTQPRDPNEPLSVWVNGVLTPPTTSAGVVIWTWNAVTNSVDFVPEHMPAERATVEISYTVGCI